MNGIGMLAIAIVVLGGGYLFYGKYLEKKWGIDPNAKTPAGGQFAAGGLSLGSTLRPVIAVLLLALGVVAAAQGINRPARHEPTIKEGG